MYNIKITKKNKEEKKMRTNTNKKRILIDYIIKKNSIIKEVILLNLSIYYSSSSSSLPIKKKIQGHIQKKDGEENPIIQFSSPHTLFSECRITNCID